MKNKSVLFGILLCSLVLTLTGCTKNSFSGKETIFEKQKQVTNLENLQLTFGTQKITTELKPPIRLVTLIIMKKLTIINI